MAFPRTSLIRGQTSPAPSISDILPVKSIRESYCYWGRINFSFRKVLSILKKAGILFGILESLSLHSEDEPSCSCWLASMGGCDGAAPHHTLKKAIFSTWTVKSKQASCPDLGRPHMVLFGSPWSHLPAYKNHSSEQFLG